MEVIQIYDTVKKSLLKVKVTPQIAKRCKRDPAYTQALLLQVRNRNSGDNALVKNIPIANAESKGENNDVEKVRGDFWSTRETQELITVYKTCRSQPDCPDSMKALSDVVAQELEKIGIQKTPLQCRRKWAYLLQTYYQAVGSQGKHPFAYIEEMAKAIYAQPTVSTEGVLSADNTGEGKEKAVFRGKQLYEMQKWTRYETLKFLQVYQKFKNDRLNFPSRNQFYTVISDSLAKDGIFKSSSQLYTKWKHLSRAYRMYNRSKTRPKKFKFFEAINCVINDVELPEPDPDEVGSDPELEGDTLEYSYWTAEETLQLIRFYKKHLPSFRHMPRKDVWDLIASELMSEGFDKEPLKCEFKWKNLLRSYRRNKNNKGSRFYFLREMKSIMDKIDSCKYVDKYDDESQELTDEESTDGDNDKVDAHDDNTDVIEDENENDEENGTETTPWKLEPIAEA